jgi:hypothetical protein
LICSWALDIWSVLSILTLMVRSQVVPMMRFMLVVYGMITTSS